MTMLKTVDDVTVPAIGLGTWQMTGETCKRAVESAITAGYRHIDTAEAYDNEAAVGEGIAAADTSREDLFLTTKVWRTNLAPADVRTHVQNSLDRLGTDYVDLLLVHWPNPDIPLAETLGAFQDLRQDGAVRHIGVSNFTAELLEEAVSIAPELVTNQVETHVYFQQKDMIKQCRENDMFLTAYSPLARGNALENEVLQQIAAEKGVAPAQVALRWLIQQDPVVAIPKTSNLNYQQENLAATDVSLTDEEMARIDSIKKQHKYVDPGFAPW